MCEIMEILNEPSSDEENDQGVANAKDVDVVYIPPPNVDFVTDEEDLDDDQINLNDKNDLYLSEIAGNIELQYSVEGDNVEDTVELKQSGVEKPSTSSANGRQTNSGGVKRKSDFYIPIWRKPRNFQYSRAPVNNEANKLEEIYAEIEITNFTNEYANQHNAAINVTTVEIRRFIGILYISGYHTLPHIDHYWSVRPDMGIQIVKQAMSRNRFKIIKRFLHLADNTDLNTEDRFAK
ncbi:PREDICTED: piggyBac transposable element-derived protein 2-like, partial [Rhagoletis zephyria]